MDLLDRMLGHDRWTTDRLLTMCRDLSDAQLDQEFDIGHRTLRTTFDHMLLALEVWTGLMIGEPVPWKPRRASIDTMLARHTRAYDQFEHAVRGIIASNRLDDTLVDNHGVRQSYGATIIHLIFHHVQHRSEVLHILQRLGIDNLPEGDPQEWEHLTGRL